jgi:hypothetical protein
MWARYSWFIPLWHDEIPVSRRGFNPSMEIAHIVLGTGPEPINLYIPKRFITFYDAPGTGSGFVNMILSYEQLMAGNYLDENGNYKSDLTNISEQEDEMPLQLQPEGADLDISFADSLDLYKSIKIRDDCYGLTVYQRNGRGSNFGTENGIYLRPNDRASHPDTYMDQAVGINPAYPCKEYSTLPNDTRMRVSFFLTYCRMAGTRQNCASACCSVLSG